MITDQTLSTCANIRHGFFTRTGGVSEGLYASLNTGKGSDDKPHRVAENRSRVAHCFGRDVSDLITLYQTHSRDVVVVRSTSIPVDVRGDALVSDEPGHILGVQTADCAPVLLCDPVAGVVAAAHAGWLGAFRGIISATVGRMIKLGARTEQIVAVVGPAIAQNSYEVGPEYFERFINAGKENDRFFVPANRRNHFMFDLPSYVLHRLRACGIINCRWTGHDTCDDQANFFSYRRSRQRGERDYGRQISCIQLT